MSKPDRHKYSGHYVCSLAPCLPDPHGLSKRRACLGVNTLGHKYCIPLIIWPLAYPGRPASLSVAGQMRTFPERTSRLGTPLKFPRCLGIPSPAGLGRELRGRGRRGSRRRPQPPGALGTCYLTTQKASGRIPFGTPGKAFNFISRHVNIPECPIGETLFCTEQYKYPIFYSTGALFLHKVFFSFLCHLY